KKIDVLVNNAGIAIKGTADIKTEDFEKIIKINLLGAFYVMHEVVPYMKQQRSGHIINMASTAAKDARANLGAYAASKFGLAGYSDALFKELADFNIDVSTLCPGMVATEMSDGSPIPDTEKIQPEDIAESIEYILKLSQHAIVKEIVIKCRKKI
ncbi:MAG: SDR family oxidoreductase, partial [Pseudomonadota bacterium]